ncbi:MAG: hypothetical protein ABIR00_01170 [Nitrosospira sp.]
MLEDEGKNPQEITVNPTVRYCTENKETPTVIVPDEAAASVVLHAN